LTEWKRVGYLKTSDVGPFEQHEWRYHLELPTPLADWDVWDYWERARTEHMASVLKPGDCLYDVGTEFAWLSVVYASMVGAGNMVLIEPSTPMWPSIKATWERNGLALPSTTFHGLVGAATGRIPAGHLTSNGWPDATDGPMIGKTAYTYLHDNPADIPATTLDDLAAFAGAPDAITIDVEGAELLVLQGAARTLTEHRPHVWVSIHPDLMARDYGATPDAVHEFMAGHGYVGTHLSTDHEQHWHFAKAGER